MPSTFNFLNYQEPLPDPFPGEYKLIRQVGEGAFGTVWEALDLNLKIPVAMKTLKIPLTDPNRDTAFERLKCEAELIAQVRHPNVVQVRAWRDSEALEHYLIMEFVRGGSLTDVLRAAPGGFPWDKATRYVADVGEALQAVHKRGIVHRDVKPSNILLDDEADEARLTDFGVSVRLQAPDGSVGGTLSYMAPEAFHGAVEAPVDVYALAATLFHLVSGEAPFVADREGKHLDAILAGLPPKESRLNAVPESIEQLIRDGLRYDPAHRPSLSDFVSRLRGALNQSLADAVVVPASTAAKGVEPVRLTLGRYDGGGFQPIATSHHTPGPQRATRDLKRVPATPKTAAVRTGERVRIQAVLDREGYLTVFNIGPTGNLNLLYPEDATAPPRKLAAGTVDVIEVEFEPPVGKERVFAFWSRVPLPLAPNDLRGLIEDKNASETSAYRATRDMRRVKDSVQKLPPNDWHAVGLELDHRTGS